VKWKQEIMFRSEKAKNYILSIISLVLAIILFCIGGEIVMRVCQKFQSHSGKTVKTILTIDNELGWLPSPNYFFDGNKIDASGKSYSVKIQINDQGFRIFGNPREKIKPKRCFWVIHIHMPWKYLTTRLITDC